ncbi:MAG: phospho-N-acetylmuramoyl-pentapeptide-transferase [Flavobacteriales bacterium]|nr:phospho-N-acetylmuramoyl-pentapeptide-transferase [Flavobacteriales bacterium]|tara:strand:+ start:6699 stop:7934 length:1236 start_codon:yes stop_codon:yes gene_type:complete
MLYYVFEYLNDLNFPGAGAFQYITTRAAFAIILSLIISMILGKRIIKMLHRLQVGETVRDLGLEGQIEKAGTPTMGGLLILAAILIPTVLFAKLDNIYIIMLLVSTVWLGLIGFLDDYIKVFKKNKEGLKGKAKIIGQVGIGIIVGTMLFFSDDVVIEKSIDSQKSSSIVSNVSMNNTVSEKIKEKSLTTTIPFFKNNELDYGDVVEWLGLDAKKWGWIVFIPVVIIIITAVSNGANLTDGIDGLATGTSAIIGVALGILAYVSGNVFFAEYLNIMYIPDTGELVIFMGSFVGACVGFLWYNSYPAQVFMGDTGSLALGGIIATFAIAIRKELLIPILCGIFLVENVSVIVQVAYFKYTKKKYGVGKRVFKMAPLHHHYQKSGYHEAKIVGRFWIVGILLAIFAIATLKLR